LWLRAQGFTRVVSLLGSTHNLHAYEELGLEWSRFPMPAASETPGVLAALYPSLHGWLRNGERLLLHQEELGDCVMGVVAGYLLWSEILPDGPRAITMMEQLLRRQMGTVGRMIVAAVDEVHPVESAALEVPGELDQVLEPKSAPGPGEGETEPAEGDAAAVPEQAYAEPEAEVTGESERAQSYQEDEAGRSEGGGVPGQPVAAPVDPEGEEPGESPSFRVIEGGGLASGLS
jgi:hypothetical protein